MLFRSLLRLAGLAAVILTLRRAAMIRRIPAELRVPATYLPVSVTGKRSLARLRRALAIPTPIADGVTHHVEQIDGGPDVHVYVRDGAGSHARTAGAVLWIHGGGYVMGEPPNDHIRCSELALALRVPVVSVDYRLAPEHPAPAAVDDAWAALQWLVDEHDLAPDRIVLAGASAGAGIAAALAQRAHDEGVDVALQLLIYPMLDDRTTRRPAGRKPWLVWTAASNRFGWRSYLAGRPETPYAVPARREDLTGLPPAWIGVGDLDQFHDECVEYAQRLTEAGVPCELHVQAGLYHGADMLFTDRTEPSREFLERIVKAGRLALRPRV